MNWSAVYFHEKESMFLLIFYFTQMSYPYKSQIPIRRWSGWWRWWLRCISSQSRVRFTVCGPQSAIYLCVTTDRLLSHYLTLASCRPKEKCIFGTNSWDFTNVLWDMASASTNQPHHMSVEFLERRFYGQSPQKGTIFLGWLPLAPVSFTVKRPIDDVGYRNHYFTIIIAL